ncbi:MAG: EDSAP-1 family PEP-CTERM protein [Candidatus Competibacterales bacterium]
MKPIIRAAQCAALFVFAGLLATANAQVEYNGENIASPFAGAYSYLSIDNFRLLTPTNGETEVTVDTDLTQLDVTDFSQLSINNIANLSAQMGDPDQDAGSANNIAGPLNEPIACAPTGSAVCASQADNNFTQESAIGIDAFASADMDLAGATINDAGGNSDAIPDGTDNSVTAQTEAEALSFAEELFSANARVGTNTTATLNITPSEDFVLVFQFDAIAELEAATAQDQFSVAFASIAWSIFVDQVDNGANLFTWSPSGSGDELGIPGIVNSPFTLNTARSASDAGSNASYSEATDGTTGQFLAFTPVLEEGVEYQITINHVSGADAEADETPDIPAPFTLALMGVGLLALRTARRS